MKRARTVRLRALMPALLWSGLAIGLGAVATSAALLAQRLHDNRLIAVLAEGRDVEVGEDASAALMFARAHYLLVRDRLDDARAPTERLALGDARRFAFAALYDQGNAHLRRALEIVDAHRYDDTIAQVNLAKEHYLRALRIDPGDWDAKFNLDVAMRLVRDFPDGEAEGDEEPPEQPDRLWTDLPGLPRGGP
jgi:mxaK protein